VNDQKPTLEYGKAPDWPRWKSITFDVVCFLLYLYALGLLAGNGGCHLCTFLTFAPSHLCTFRWISPLHLHLCTFLQSRHKPLLAELAYDPSFRFQQREAPLVALSSSASV
jgi:hypothetical protein